MDNIDDLGPDNTDDKYIMAVRSHLGIGSPAMKSLDEMVHHVWGVMNHWCRIIDMKQGEDMRDFPKVLRRMMNEGKEPTAWIIERQGCAPTMTHYKTVADSQRSMGAIVTPYCSQF